MQAVEFRVACHQFGKSRYEMLGDAGRCRVEIETPGSHPVPGAVGVGHLEAGVIEQRTTGSVDEDRLGAEHLEDPGIAILAEGENVHPGMHPQTPGVSRLDETGQGVGTGLGHQFAIGRCIRKVRCVPTAAAAIDLDKEVGHPESDGRVQQGRHPGQVLQRALRPFAEHPESPGARNGPFREPLTSRLYPGLGLGHLGPGRGPFAASGPHGGQQHDRQQDAQVPARKGDD